MALDPRQPVRVLQVVRPAVGGMRAHVLQLATGLRALGFASEIACPSDSDLVHDALEAKVPVHPVPITGPLHPLKDPLAVIALAEVLRERRPAIVHAHGSKAGLIARLAVPLSGNRAAVIVTVHNQVLYGGISPLMRGVYIAMERWLARRTARIITVSDALRTEQLQVFHAPPEKVVRVYDGLDLGPYLGGADRSAARARLGLPERAVAIGLAARFAPQKGQVDLIEAALPVLEAEPDAWLVLAGDGPLLEVARTKARATRVRDRILFPGFETDVPGLLAALDVYASASVAEGLGLGTIEAMAAGLPVVATAVGGTPEVVDDGVTGILVPPRKTARMSEALARLVRDPAARRVMGEAGRQRALETFGEANMFEQIAHIYREVLAG